MSYNPYDYTNRYIKKTDPDYPEKLKRYVNMPSGFYLKGSLPDPAKKSVAIVGARKCSSYGEQAARYFARTLASNGVQIISGLATGIDSYAHKGCLEGGGSTFAVLGCGVNIIYPKSNSMLYKSILDKGGGLISEYDLTSPALPFNFPTRNRIISALSDALLIVEARIKSGSLITASYALEQGIPIFVVPGKITDSLSAGTNSLLMQGAYPALSPDDILYELGIRREKKEEKNISPLHDPSFSKTEKQILKSISDTPLPLDNICQMCNLDIAKVSTILLQLELKGAIYQPSPGLYAIAYS